MAILQPGQSFQVDAPLYSDDGTYRVVLQNDGNLVLYGPTDALWASGTNGQSVSQCIMQTDGNLVIYGCNGPIWASNTSGNPGAYLKLQNDGMLAIYSPGGGPFHLFYPRFFPK
jgi:hypothetical protein